MAELQLSAAVGSIVLLIALSAAFSLARSLALAERTARQNNDEGRVADYIARDFRGALSASLSGSILTITLPDYFNGTTPRDPTVVGGKTVQYGPTPQTVRYYFQNGAVIRELNGTAVVIAQDISTFTMTDQLASTTPGTVVVSPRLKSSTALSKVVIQVKRAKTITD